jgi:TolB protein
LNLFLFNLVDNKITPLTFGSHNDLEPDWSLDGKSIVFSSDRNGSYDLYLLSFEPENEQALTHPGDSSKVGQLTSLLTGGFDPSFSADGKTIYFTAYENYSFQIHKMSRDTVIANYVESSEGGSLGTYTAQTSWMPKKIEGGQKIGSHSRS